MASDIEPGSGCPGGLVEKGPRAGSTLPLCITCTRLGGRQLPPAATLEQGQAQCANFMPLAQGLGGAAATGQGG